MTTIEILVTTDGKTRVQTKGFSGQSCRDGSRFIEQALGHRIAESLTAEFHEVQANRHHQQQRS